MFDCVFLLVLFNLTRLPFIPSQHVPYCILKVVTASPAFLASAGIFKHVFLNVYGARESIPRNEFREPM
jgi:hypothetical protein